MAGPYRPLLAREEYASSVNPVLSTLYEVFESLACCATRIYPDFIIPQDTSTQEIMYTQDQMTGEEK